MSNRESRSQDGYQPQRISTGAPIVGNAVVTRADENSLTRVDSAGGARTFTLPALTAVPLGFTVYLQKLGAGANTVTITPVGADTVNGAADDTIAVENTFAVIIAASTTDWAALIADA